MSAFVGPGRVPQRDERVVAKSRVALGLLVVLAATLAVYLPCAWHYFYLDDFWHLLTASQTRWSGLWRPWRYTSQDVGAYWFAAGAVHHLTEPAFFRPLVTGLFKAGLAGWGLNPLPFHLINIAGQLASVAVVYWLLRRLVDGPNGGWPATLGAAVFGLHPAHYAAVEWIAANADILVALFGLLSVAAYVESARRAPPDASRPPSRKARRGWYLLSLACFLLALGTKEIAVTIPLLLVGVEWLIQHSAAEASAPRPGDGGDVGKVGWREAVRRRGRAGLGMIRRRWGWYLPFAVVLGAYVLWRIPAAVGVYSFNEGGGGYLVGLSSVLTLPHLVLNFSFYVLEFVLLYPIWPINFARFGWLIWPLALAAVAVLAGLAWGGSRLIGGGPRAAPMRGLYWLGLWWLAATLGPFSFLAPIQRMAHFPEAGFALALTALAMGVEQRMRRARRRGDPAPAEATGEAAVQPSPSAAGRSGGAPADHASRPHRWLAGALVVLLMVYGGLSASYAAMMGQVASRVRAITRGLDAQVANLPPHSEIDLLNLWQPAWMFEHFFAVRYPHRDYHLHVLAFDPDVLPPDVRADPGPAARWFERLFPQDAGEASMQVRWPRPRTLRVSLRNGVFFQGVVEAELPVAAQAKKPGHPIDAGPFVAQATRRNGRGVTALSFRWKPRAMGVNRLFLRWERDHWRRLEPPTGWSRERPMR